ncbi:Cobalt-zinc-cadmium resistance protein [Serinicoccus hydrothermalis]|uniref:Cobalt-zinc-cadmium resistance protein n=1 Tax=Serinicoccus hydrothermalis TaxID=1758689 RepID=A0A1B1ND31_9MICO|nr:cation diffusion facilitator family transporter [Serinicoccus hydrothermalis]ANS79342.1 Cobalt-zinc-cadmium resistance protein [Serinicoccus hydrothermalis]
MPGPTEKPTLSTRHPAPEDLTRYAWLSIATAIATILLKGTAWWLTDSVGLLSDAAESSVNLVAAVVALVALRVAIKPPDRKHNFGHSKAEYFSAAVEGVMIFIAAAVILMASVRRFLDPSPLENVGIGLAIAILASVLNGTVAWVLLRAGKKHRSITLVADGKHLLTDVWTSVGVVVGVILVWLTGWERLDPIIAFAVGVNILVTGWGLLRASTAGLMDGSLPAEDNARIVGVIETFIARFEGEDVHYHAIRTRESGHRRFMEMHLLVPGIWTVKRGHDVAEDLTDALLVEYPDLRVHLHLEPVEDPRSYEDIGI